MKTSSESSMTDPIHSGDECFAEDGISPRELAKRKLAENRKRSRGKPNHHARQLSVQIHRALDDALACDCGDPLLENLSVAFVEPVAKSNTYEVTLVAPQESLTQLAAIYESLASATGLLRNAVGCAIHRKKVPQLRFVILPESSEG